MAANVHDFFCPAYLPKHRILFLDSIFPLLEKGNIYSICH